MDTTELKKGDWVIIEPRLETRKIRHGIVKGVFHRTTDNKLMVRLAVWKNGINPEVLSHQRFKVGDYHKIYFNHIVFRRDRLTKMPDEYKAHQLLIHG